MKKHKPAVLIHAATAAANNAYCPYSGFAVGAALLAAGGEIILGCNVENASYGLSLCAERNAIAAAIGAGYRRFRALAIVAGPTHLSRRPSPPFPPCGACRQILAEFCPPAFPVYVAAAGDLKHFRKFTLRQLLPHPFLLR